LKCGPVDHKDASVLGHSHAASGAFVWIALASTVPPTVLDLQLQPHDLLVGAAVCAGSALLPDLDHPGSLIANFLGPPSELLARLVSLISGGHRQGTHSLLFVALVWAGTWLGIQQIGRVFVLGVVFFTVALALQGLRLCPPGSGFREWGAIGLQAGIATWVVSTYLPGVPDWLSYAVSVGALAHLLGDCLTTRGVPLLWPLRTRFAFPVIERTGNWVETWILVPAMSLGAVGMFWYSVAG
jgi:membrane-bound metal-dependent hydrolase YbcI (DUF457 family)